VLVLQIEMMCEVRDEEIERYSYCAVCVYDTLATMMFGTRAGV
jgi:hypothetical protein